MRKTALVFVLGVLALALAAPAAAQKFEFGVSWTFINPSLDTSYVHGYSPLYLSVGSYTSSALQTIHMKAKSISGLSAVINYFPTPHIGFQFLADYQKPSLEGTNGAYGIALSYQRPLPDGTFAPASYGNSIDWPVTDGELRQITLSFNLIYRLPLTRSIKLNLSGGPSYFYSEGKGAAIGYTKFYTSSDRLLHIQNYQLAYEWGPEAKIGFNIGAELAFHLSSMIALTGEFRYFKCAAPDSSLHITSSDVITDTPAEIEQVMNLGKIEFDPSFTRFGVGIKFVF